MVVRVSMARSRVYADEPQVFIVSGLEDTADSNWWKFRREKFRDELSPGNLKGWDETSDSYAFSYDANEIPPGLPTTWQIGDVRELYASGAFWTILSWDPSTGTMAVYAAPVGSCCTPYRYGVMLREDDRPRASIEFDVVRENMPESLRATYLPVDAPPPPPVEEEPEEPPIDEPEPPVITDPLPEEPPAEEPPMQQPPSSALPAITTTTLIGGGLLLAVLHKPTRKRIEKMIRRIRI